MREWLVLTEVLTEAVGGIALDLALLVVTVLPAVVVLFPVPVAETVALLLYLVLLDGAADVCALGYGVIGHLNFNRMLVRMDY